jgi:hypothetical protein
LGDRDDNFIYLEALDADHSSKYLVLALAIITIVVSSPMMFAVVKFESNCHNRTLVNRIIGVQFALMIIWNFTVNLPSLIRYLSGPFPVLLCQLEYLNKNAMTLILAIFADFALIIRYIFVVKSRNPTAVQDEFWMFFLGMWTVGFALICQTTTLIYPGKEPITFYFCTGKMPKVLVGEKVKNNASFTFIFLVSGICHAYIHVKLAIHKCKENQSASNVQTEEQQGSTSCHSGIQSILLNRMKQENLFSLASNVLSITILASSSIAINIMNRTDPTTMNEFPNYLWVYLHQHVTVNVVIFLALFLRYYKKPLLVNSFKTLIQQVVDAFRVRFR